MVGVQDVLHLFEFARGDVVIRLLMLLIGVHSKEDVLRVAIVPLFEHHTLDFVHHCRMIFDTYCLDTLHYVIVLVGYHRNQNIHANDNDKVRLHEVQHFFRHSHFIWVFLITNEQKVEFGDKS